MNSMKTLQYGREAWKYLNGIFCVYKPSGLSVRNVLETLRYNLCRDLNELKQRDPQGLVVLKGSVCLNKPYEVEMVQNYADHELVVGPRYQEQDIRMRFVYKLGRNTSGVFLMAVNNGCREADNLKYFIRKYEIKGKFGLATRNFMSDGIVLERSTYRHIKQPALDRLLASIQASHQSLAFKYSGIDMQSQAAYDLASTGLVKPSTKTDPLIYNIKCTDLSLPDFTLEVHCINETEEFLAELIHDIGIDLKSTAVCTQLRQTQFGHFVLSHALLRKHWTLENILNNLTLCKAILGKESSSVDSRTVKSIKQNQLLDEMQQVAREEQLL